MLLLLYSTPFPACCTTGAAAASALVAANRPNTSNKTAVQCSAVHRVRHWSSNKCLHKAHVVGLELWSLLVVFSRLSSQIFLAWKEPATVTTTTNLHCKYLVKKRGRKVQSYFFLFCLAVSSRSFFNDETTTAACCLEDDLSFSFAFILRNLHFPLL